MLRLPIVRMAGYLAVVALTVAGCTGVLVSPSPSPSPSETPSPVVSPSEEPAPTPTQDGPEPTFEPHLDPADLLIWTRGLGPLAVGNEPPESNPGAAMIAYFPTYCGDTTDDPVFDSKGRWAPYGYDNTDVSLTGEPVTPFAVDADVAAVHRIDVLGVGPRTDKGIGLGSTLAELQAAHGDRLVGPFKGLISSVWIIEDRHGAIAFETAEYREGFTDHVMKPGDEPIVIMIRILHPELPADFTVLDGGAVAGAC